MSNSKEPIRIPMQYSCDILVLVWLRNIYIFALIYTNCQCANIKLFFLNNGIATKHFTDTGTEYHHDAPEEIVSFLTGTELRLVST